MTHSIPILIPVDHGSPSRALFLLDLPVVVGRGWEAGIRVDGPDVDAKHCEIYQEGEDVAVRDLKSWAGTYVNGDRIGERRLQVGDRLRIADSTFQISAFGDPTKSAICNASSDPAELVLNQMCLSV